MVVSLGFYYIICVFYLCLCFRGSGTSPDAVIGMSFFTAKVDRVKSVFLVTLGMNGHLRLWMGSNSQATMQWTSLHSEFVYRNLTDGGATGFNQIIPKVILFKKQNRLCFKFKILISIF